MALLCVIGAPKSAHAQAVSTGSAGLTGQVGFAGEAYMASGISNRRDPTSGLVFGNASASGRDLTYGFQFLLATEQTGSRQTMNRFSGNLSYSLLRLTAGDFSPILSEFSINGTTIRGGAMEISQGPAVASFMAGRMRRPVESTRASEFGRTTFREWLYAARLGAGAASKTHVHLIGVVARDASDSLPDSLFASPRENVSITPDAAVHLLEDRLQLRATYTLSAFSANTRSARADSDVPSMLGLFTPRVGSQVDYAGEIGAKLNLDNFRLGLGYERIQPGFRSLSIRQRRSDQAIFRVEPAWLSTNRRANLNLRFSSTRNNLEGNRAATLKRRNVSLHGRFLISRTTSLVAAYSNMMSRNEIDESALSLTVAEQRNLAQMFMLAPTFTVVGVDRTHVISLNTTYQFLRDKGDAANEFSPKFDNLSATAAYAVAFATGYSINASAGYLSSKTPFTDAGAINLSLGGGTSFSDRRARISMTGGWSRNTLDISSADATSLSANQLSLRITGSYRVPSGSTVRLSVRALRNSGDLTSSFNELQATLRFEHRF